MWDLYKDTWQNCYKSLKNFSEKNDHCNPPQDFKVNNVLIRSWIRRQRNQKHNLTEEQIKKINTIKHWDWDPTETAWNTGFSEFTKFIKINGHGFVDKNYKCENGFNLGSWVVVQRKQKLNETRKKKLEQTGHWIWSVYDVEWENGFKNIQEYVKINGHANVSNNDLMKNGFGVGRWVNRQRQNYKRKKIDLNKIKKLNNLGCWVWDTLDAKWEIGFEELKKYEKLYGNTNISDKYKANNGYSLGGWIYQQRTNYRKNKILPERKSKLDNIKDWVWEKSKVNNWMINYYKLKTYVETNEKICSVKFIDEDGILLGKWTSHQKSNFMQGKLSKEQNELLKKIPKWGNDELEERWQKGYDYLKVYVEKNKSLPVQSYNSEDGFKLGSWLSVQKVNYKTLKMSKKRIVLLEKIPGW